MEYSFDIEIATVFGVTASILLKNIGFWIAKNTANKKHRHDDLYWTYNSYIAFAKLYPFWTPRQIRTCLDKLCEEEILFKGNFNEKGYDKTNWYTIIDPWVHSKYVAPLCPPGQKALTWKSDGSDSQVKPIPYSKPDVKSDKANAKEESFGKELITLFFTLYQRKAFEITGRERTADGKDIKPSWGGKESKLFYSDLKRTGVKEIRNSMLLFFSDTVPEVTSFTRKKEKAGYAYGVFHGCLDKLLLSRKTVQVCGECFGINRHEKSCSVALAKITRQKEARAEVEKSIEDRPDINVGRMFKDKVRGNK